VKVRRGEKRSPGGFEAGARVLLRRRACSVEGKVNELPQEEEKEKEEEEE